MPIFEATATTLDGHRAIRLDYSMHTRDRNPKRITLVEEIPLSGFGRLPFSYQYTEETIEQPIASLDIVAAPGVSVIKENYPATLPSPPTNPAPYLRVFRVQDPGLVPHMAGDIESTHLVGSYEEGPDFWIGYPPQRSIHPPNYFVVDRGPSGVRICHPHTNTAVRIEAAQYTETRDRRLDARQRFAYEIDIGGVYGDARRPLLKIVKTPNVTVTLEMGVFPDLVSLLTGRAMPPPGQLFWWELYETNDVNDIPPQGAPITRQRGWRRLTSVSRQVMPAETFGQAVFDTAVGVIPIVGDLVEIAEFFYALGTGMDRWGRRLKTWEVVLLGICAVLPFVIAGSVRGGGQLLRHFGRHSESARQTIQDLQRARLSPAEAEALEEALTLIQQGRRLPDRLLTVYNNILQRIRRDFPVAQDYLNPERNGFIHADLQRYYQDYCRRVHGSGGRPREPMEWVRYTRGAPRRLLIELLGSNFVARSRAAGSGRHINLNAVPRPDNYPDSALRQHLDQLNQDSARVTDRLENLLALRRSGNALTRFMSRNRVNVGYFWILKGNIAESFSMVHQRRILRSIATRHPHARIFQGVRIQLMSNGRLSREMLFSDNIIAEIRGGNLYLRGLIEVKSGQRGGEQAAEQIFRWIERNITDGSQVVIPRGARIMDAAGQQRITTQAMAFTYNPGSSDPNQIINLMRADRHVIIPQGSSYIGLGSGMHVSAGVTTHHLSQTSAQLDFITARMLQSL